MTFEIKPCGDISVTVQFKQKIDEAINDAVIGLSNALRGEGILECIPAYCALTVVYDPLVLAYEALCNQIREAYAHLEVKGQRETRVVEIPVHYGGHFGPDLSFVAEHAQLTESEVITLHTAPLYRVYMIGFTPGFPYLGGLNPKLETPRLSKPRTAIEKGSVGIAGSQTGVYPLKSPGGWQLIGKTDCLLFDLAKENPFLLQAGDCIKFKSIDEGDSNCEY